MLTACHSVFCLVLISTTQYIYNLIPTHSGSSEIHMHAHCRKVQDVKIRRNYELQAKAYRASDVISGFGNAHVNVDEGGYLNYEDQDIRSRTPDYTKTDIVLDELVDHD